MGIKSKPPIIIKMLTALIPAAILSFIPACHAYAAIIQDLGECSGYARVAITELANRDIISGDEKGNYKPRETTTRSQVAKVIVESLDLDTSVVPDTPTFCDVPKDDWAYKYVETAYKYGITVGKGNGLFGPNDICTREQMVAFFINSLHLTKKEIKRKIGTDTGIQKFEDSGKVSGWAADAMALAVHYRIISGTSSTTLNPGKPITREQMAVILDRFITSSLSGIQLKDVSSTISEGYFYYANPSTGMEKGIFKKKLDSNYDPLKIYPGWAYDVQVQGNRIFFYSVPDQGIYSMDMEGNDLRLITSGISSMQFVDFTISGKWIFVKCQNSVIFMVKTDGTCRRGLEGNEAGFSSIGHILGYDRGYMYFRWFAPQRSADGNVKYIAKYVRLDYRDNNPVVQDLDLYGQDLIVRDDMRLYDGNGLLIQSISTLEFKRYQGILEYGIPYFKNDYQVFKYSQDIDGYNVQKMRFFNFKTESVSEITLPSNTQISIVRLNTRDNVMFWENMAPRSKEVELVLYNIDTGMLKTIAVVTSQ